MIDLKEKLSVLYFDGTSYEDISEVLAQFKDELEKEVVLDVDKHIYIGFHKPIKNFYMQVSTPNETASEIFFEACLDESWEIISAVDETFNLTKSGFISFDNDLPEVCNINNLSLFWFRVSSDDEMLFTLSTISMLLSSINDLSAIYPPIADEHFLLGKKSLHVAMELVKNDIVQELRNKPIKLEDYRRLTVFDLLDIQELRQAASYKTVAHVLRNSFNTVDDKFYILSQEFFKKARELLDLYFLTVDFKGDGSAEVQKPSSNVQELLR